MRQVILSKPSGIGQANGEIREDGEESIVYGRPKGQVVADFVDGKEEVLICRGPDNVGREKEGPGEHSRVPQQGGADNL